MMQFKSPISMIHAYLLWKYNFDKLLFMEDNLYRCGRYEILPLYSTEQFNRYLPMQERANWLNHYSQARIVEVLDGKIQRGYVTSAKFTKRRKYALIIDSLSIYATTSMYDSILENMGSSIENEMKKVL